MMDWTDTPFWLAFGLLGNATFASRFLVQWIASERAGESVVPEVFWLREAVAAGEGGGEGRGGA